MKKDVEAAINELRKGLPCHEIRVKADADGGAFVIVDGVDIGRRFKPMTTWVGFQITFPYPDVDVYPHFIDPAVKFVGDNPDADPPRDALPTSMTRGATMPGFDLPAIQVSRRSNRRDADTDSALHKFLRVVEFVRSR